MILWRLARAAHQSLDCEGAQLYGGRWSSEGVAVVYLSSSLSLAAMEYLVHIDIEDVPLDLVALQVEVPDDTSLAVIDLVSLPADWYAVPDHPACIEHGNAWAAQRETLLVCVPSAIVRVESNYLMNPAHPDAVDVQIVGSEPFAFDGRLPGG